MNTKFQIETARLRLQTMSIGNLNEVYKYRSDSMANRFQGWIPKTPEEVKDFIENKTSPEINIPGTWHQLVILEKAPNELIGDVGLHFLPEDHQVEIGITLSKEKQGSGFAKEAIEEVLKYLFTILEKHRVITSVDPMNVRSRVLFERLGFRREAHFVKSLLLNGEWQDDLVYAMLEEEWLQE